MESIRAHTMYNFKIAKRTLFSSIYCRAHNIYDPRARYLQPNIVEADTN